mmetsp:Transcript_14218/g.27406  ORF Transcript_14218/g.27406 Transcript_14218/m.27406 type:complete len:273 (-) Transcript_14218:70-888(-)
MRHLRVRSGEACSTKLTCRPDAYGGDRKGRSKGRFGLSESCTTTCSFPLRASRTSVSDTESEREKKKLAVFASGGGSNFRAIHSAIEEGRINASIDLVVSDKLSCGATAFAADKGIECLRYPDKSESEQGFVRLLESLKGKHSIDFIILAGYMKFIPPELVQEYERGILNMHPALLPAFGGKGYYGMRVHEAVIKSGVRFSGATVHFVNEEYDRGPIVAQACVPVSPGDSAESLAARVLKREHELYPDVVEALCDGRIEWREDGKPVLWTAK